MQHPVGTVFQLNSQAVHLLQQSKYREAAATLRVATETLQQDPTGFHLLPNMTGYGSQADNEIKFGVSITSFSIELDQVCFTEPSKAVANSLVGDTLLFQPFEGAFCTPFWNYEGPRGLCLTWAFLFYNLALCYHHQEMKTGTMGKQTLLGAVRLYLSGLNILRQDMNDGNQEDILLLMMAFHNNMGHIYSHLQMLDSSRECIIQLRATLMGIPLHVRDTLKGSAAYEFFQIEGLVVPEDIFNKAPAA